MAGVRKHPKTHGGAQARGAATTAVHAGEVPDARTGAVNIPIHLSSTFWFPELPDGSKAPYIYSRYSNPSCEAVEAKVAALEGARGSLLFSSGMAAIMTACTSLLKAGDTIAVQSGVYGGTTAFLRDELARFGIKLHQLPPTQAAKPPKGTKLVWMEAITNPLLRVADVRAWAKAAHDAGALLGVDATFASPIVQRPLEHGADVVMHSATKYLGGHADLIAGVLSWKDDGLREAFWRVRRNWGPTPDPHMAYLLGRGIKTLPLRMERHCSNALALAKEAEGMAGVVASHYPGLPSHPDHRIAKSLMPNGFGGALTLDLGSLANAKAFRRTVKVIAPAASLGGVESLASLPIETSHAYSSAAKRKEDGITDGLVRISVGIEDIGDLIADVKQAAR